MKSFDDERYTINTMIGGELGHCHCACDDLNEAISVARKLRDSFCHSYEANPDFFEAVEKYAVYDWLRNKVVYVCGNGFELF